MTVDQLPVECLEEILLHLRDDIASLNALLKVSPAFFALTLPLLYASPFRLLDTVSAMVPRVELERRKQLLARTLIESAALQQMGQNWGHGRIPYQQQQQQQQQQETADRIHTLENAIITGQRWNQESPCGRPHYWQKCPLLSQPFRGSERSEKGAKEADERQTADGIELPKMATNFNYLRYYHSQFHSDLAFLSPDLAMGDNVSLTRLDLQIFMARYNIPGLKQFGLALEPRLYRLLPELLSARRLSRLELNGVTENSDLRPIVDFIEQHTLMYGTLKEIKVQGTGHNHDPVSLVQAMGFPHHVDLSLWQQPIMSAEFIPSECVQTLLFRVRERVPSIITSTFLNNCKRLSRIQMHVHNPYLFRAAPESLGRSIPIAKLDRPFEYNTGTSGWNGAESSFSSSSTFPSLSRSSSMTSLSTSPNSFTMDYSPKPTTLFQGKRYEEPQHWARHSKQASWEQAAVDECLPMASMTLGGEVYILATCLLDAVSMFKCTLEEVIVHSWANIDGIDRPLTLSWNWPMNSLFRLELDGPIVLSFDLDSLHFCPLLKILSLQLPELSHSVSGHKLVSIASLVQLQELSLIGKWYITDHVLESLSQHLQNVVTINLDGVIGPSTQSLLKSIDHMSRLESFCGMPVSTPTGAIN